MTTKKKVKAFVLISGGIDSSTTLALAASAYRDVEGISLDYNQRHKKEMEYAARQCVKFGASHTVLPIGDLLRGTMLTERSQAIPDTTYDEITGVSPTYVPFRNGTLLSIAAAHAQRWVNCIRGRQTNVDPNPEAIIYIGTHAEDARNWAYPDCTPEFIGAMANAIYVGTYGAVRLVAPFVYSSKSQLIQKGYELGVDFSQTWSCYAGEHLHCGKCPTCYARQTAFDEAGLIDPTVYAVPRKAA